MEPIFGFALLLAACTVVALVASRKGRSGAVFFFAPALSALPTASIVTLVSGGNSWAVGLSVFFCPLVGLVVALSMSDARRKVAEPGAGD